MEASAVDAQSPETQFRQHQAIFQEALDRRDLPAAEKAMVAGQNLATEQAWIALVATNHIALGQTYADVRQFKEALRHFNQALNVTEPAYAGGDVLAGTTSVSAWLGIGFVYARQREKNQALAHFQLATERAEALNNPILAIQGYFQQAHIYHSRDQTRLANAAYDRLFALAETLPTEQRSNAHLMAIAQTFYQQQPTYDTRRRAQLRLTDLLGADWNKG